MVGSLPTLPEGVYIVRWNVVTASLGDLVGGVFTFSVGDRASVPHHRFRWFRLHVPA